MLLQFPLSDEPEDGRWTVRAEAASTVTEHSFLVQYYYPTRFEVTKNSGYYQIYLFPVITKLSIVGIYDNIQHVHILNVLQWNEYM